MKTGAAAIPPKVRKKSRRFIGVVHPFWSIANGVLWGDAIPEFGMRCS
jgi:hypothetical protein